MSPLLVILAVWLGLAMLVIGAGLWISRSTGPDRYLVLHDIEPREQADGALDYREAA
jgi:hypothetical protein